MATNHACALCTDQHIIYASPKVRFSKASKKYSIVRVFASDSDNSAHPSPATLFVCAAVGFDDVPTVSDCRGSTTEKKKEIFLKIEQTTSTDDVVSRLLAVGVGIYL